jgi:hypothetical protein
VARNGRHATWLVIAVLVVAGCGGGDDGDDSDVASIDDVEECIKDEGLDVNRSPTFEGAGNTGSLQVVLRETRNVINVNYYENEDDAKNGEEDSKLFTDQGGGEVKRRGKVVYSVFREGDEEEFEKVEGCL